MERYEKAMYAGGAVGTFAASGLAALISAISHVPPDWAAMYGLMSGGGGWMVGMYMGVKLSDCLEERRRRTPKPKPKSIFADELKNIDPLREEER